jgi:phage repressor protein C with HTH and peptisase S24 domain
MSSDRVYFLPRREFFDVTPELFARILDELPEHEEGTFAVTVKGDSMRRLLRATGATLREEHDHRAGDGR